MNQEKDNKPSNSTQQVARVEASFSGPLPPPAALEGYESTQPGAADRIIAMAEMQAKHRQEQEAKIIASNISHEKWGLLAL